MSDTFGYHLNQETGTVVQNAPDGQEIPPSVYDNVQKVPLSANETANRGAGTLKNGSSPPDFRANGHGPAHYKQGQIQTWDGIIALGLPYMESTVIRYLARWRHKNGLEDLQKARHYLDKLIEIEQAEREPKP